MIFEENKDRPDSLDSLAVEYKNLYKESFSGVYQNIYYQEVFPQDIILAIDNSLAKVGALRKRAPTIYPDAGWTILADPPKARSGC